MFLGDEIKREPPHVRERVPERAEAVRALVGTSDRFERRSKQLLPRFVSGTEAIIEVENDCLDHAGLYGTHAGQNVAAFQPQSLAGTSAKLM